MFFEKKLIYENKLSNDEIRCRLESNILVDPNSNGIFTNLKNDEYLLIGTYINDCFTGYLTNRYLHNSFNPKIILWVVAEEKGKINIVIKSSFLTKFLFGVVLFFLLYLVIRFIHVAIITQTMDSLYCIIPVICALGMVLFIKLNIRLAAKRIINVLTSMEE